MVQVGMLLSDVPQSTTPAQQFKDILRIVDAAQEVGMTYIAIGQHFLYGDLRWLQPVPLLARLAAHVEPHVKLATQILVGPMYHPVMLAEEIATLDIVTEGRLVFGIGLGYRREEFDYFGVPYKERGGRLDETLEIVKKLWTDDEVTYDGRFWQLNAVKPHIRPVQEPHPPLWVGGYAMPGVRRAGRYADGYACPPEAPLHEIAERYRVVEREFAKRGKRFSPQPLRRNTMIARTDREAAEEYRRVARGRYITYSQRGLDAMNPQELERDFQKAVVDHAVVGTSETVTKRLVEIVTSMPVEPLLLRPQWPSMDADEAVASIRTLGEQAIPSVRALQPAQKVSLRPHDQAPVAASTIGFDPS